MEWYWLVLIGYGAVAVLYFLLLAKTYFSVFEGTTRNGTIITESIWSALKWPWSLVWLGAKDTFGALIPPKLPENTVLTGDLPPGVGEATHEINPAYAGPRVSPGVVVNPDLTPPGSIPGLAQ